MLMWENTVDDAIYIYRVCLLDEEEKLRSRFVQGPDPRFHQSPRLRSLLGFYHCWCRWMILPPFQMVHQYVKISSQPWSGSQDVLFLWSAGKPEWEQPWSKVGGNFPDNFVLKDHFINQRHNMSQHNKIQRGSFEIWWSDHVLSTMCRIKVYSFCYFLKGKR